MMDLLDNPVVTDPRKHLTRTEQQALRHLAMFRVSRVRNGWFGADRKISLKTGQSLIAKGLAIQEYNQGKSHLPLTHAGRIARDVLDRRHS